jgi:excisionase family DNA binding protein
MGENATQPKLLTPAEVARELRQDRATIYRKIAGGVIPAVRLDYGRGALRVPADELDAWLGSRHVEPIPS